MKKTFLYLAAMGCLFAMPVFADGDHHDAEGKATIVHVNEHIHMIQMQGGNVGAYIGKDQVFMIDDDYANAAPAVLEAIKSLSENDISYVANTHWHGDHTGGNEAVAAEGAVIVAHDNVHKRLKEGGHIKAFNKTVEPKPLEGLPSVTYNQNATFYIDGHPLKLMHVPKAHTDGDTFIYFPEDNVVHTGDIFFNGFYPFIDASSGGSLKGMINAVDQILALTDTETKIIPGHGPLSNKAELMAYREMLSGVYDALKPMIASGKTLDEVKAENILEPFNEKWGGGFLPPEKWIGIAYEAAKANAE